MGRPALLLGRGPDAERGSQGSRRGLGCLHLGHRPVRVGTGGHSAAGRRRCAGRRLEPARVRRKQHRGRQLVGRRLATRLLFRLGCEPAGLRPKLRDDVLHPGEVRLRFDQLVLRPPPAPLVPAHPGDLLEQGPPLLRPQGEGLVDHALPDEQERVVGEMRRVEQVDEVAQADPLLVQQVVVLAGAIETSPQLEDREVDGQQAVRVVDHERDVGHALRRPPVRAGPDDVLGLARSQRPALLPEGPAQGVGEVALARAVGPDDGADPAPELDVRALRERLEALEAKCEQPRRGGSVGAVRTVAVHAPTDSGRAAARRRSTASDAASVSAVRRDGPSPTPSTTPSTLTSIRKIRSWSGPVTSTMW